MKCAWILLLVIAAAVVAQEDKAEPKPKPEARLSALKWLAGSWKGEMWGGQFHAYYSTPEGGRILSHSFLKKGGRQAFYEFEKFDVQQGEVVYIPYPGGRQAAHFLLKESPANRAVFENPKKDYPTRIVFERREKLLVITLTDPFGKNPKKEVFRLNRVE